MGVRPGVQEEGRGSLSLTHTLSHTLSISLTHSLSLSLPHTHSLSLPHTHTHRAGSVLAHSIATGKLHYTLGANAAAATLFVFRFYHSRSYS